MYVYIYIYNLICIYVYMSMSRSRSMSMSVSVSVSVPVSEFPAKAKRPVVRSPSSVGICPVKLLPDRSSAKRSCIRPRSEGSVPVREFILRSMFTSCPKSDLSGPVGFTNVYLPLLILSTQNAKHTFGKTTHEESNQETSTQTKLLELGLPGVKLSEGPYRSISRTSKPSQLSCNV